MNIEIIVVSEMKIKINQIDSAPDPKSKTFLHYLSHFLRIKTLKNGFGYVAQRQK